MKSRLLYLLFCLVALLLLTACESGGVLKIYNQTSHPVFIGLFGNTYTIAGDSVFVKRISTPTKTPFEPDAGNNVRIGITGETYQIFDDFSETFVDSTTIRIKAGETTKVFLKPNRAAVKVINNTSQVVTKVIIQRNTVSLPITTTYFPDIQPGSSWYVNEPPATPSSQYFYIAQVWLADSISYGPFGNAQNILHADDVFTIVVPPPSPAHNTYKRDNSNL